MAAEVSAAAAVATLVLKLGDLVTEHASLSLDIKDDADKLRRQLIRMQTYLDAVENNVDNNKIIKKLVCEIRDLANETEEVIETFISRLVDTIAAKEGCLGGGLCVCISNIKKGPSTRRLGEHISRLLKRVEESQLKDYALQIANIPSTSSDRQYEELIHVRRTIPDDFDSEEIIGLVDNTRVLKAKISAAGSRLFMISICGMGGLGKTTLAKKLYNDPTLASITCRAWACVSQDYDTRDVLLQVIKSFNYKTHSELESMKTDDLYDLEQDLRKWLSNKCYLVVLDDIWKVNAWLSLKRAFPGNNMGSRVIFTTRNKEVAEGVDTNAYAYELPYLSEDESWYLLCRKAFRVNDRRRSAPKFEQLGREMVGKCAGLPLAIIVLGGLLSTKSLVSEWEKVKSNLWKSLTNNSINIDAVLMLSYRDLSKHLKWCFLYVGMFPEDFEINVSKLLLLWVAERFIDTTKDEGLPEEVAKSYFHDLVARSLIQKTSEDWVDATCRVHDLLRDLAIRKAKEDNFLQHYDQNIRLPATRICGRLAAYSQSGNVPPANTYNNESLRTLLQMTQGRGRFKIDAPLTVPVWFNQLRVLDMVSVSGYGRIRIPSDIGTLIRLRYLGLPGCSGDLPETIGNLEALETPSRGDNFDKSMDFLSKLPSTVKNLKSLRHLMGRFSNYIVISKLSQLQTLKVIRPREWNEMSATDLVNLRHLSISRITSMHKIAASRFGYNLGCLQTLVLQAKKLADIPLPQIVELCPSITHLSLILWKDNLPNWGAWEEHAINIEVLELTFKAKAYKEAPVPLFEKLQNLRALSICVKNYSGKWLICLNEGFPQLQSIQFIECTELEVLVENGGMSELKRVNLKRCRDVELPERLKQIMVRGHPI